MGIPTYIIGVGGLGRGVAETVKEIANRDRNWVIEGFIDEQVDQHGKCINGLEVLGDLSLLINLKKVSNIVIAIANPKAKKKIYERLSNNQFLLFPNVVHSSSNLNPTVDMGIGNIISDHVSFSSNISVGSFTLIHFNSSIGHDVVIEDFSTIFPGVNLSGFCEVKTQCQIGTNVSVLPQTTIGERAFVGAGAMVNRNVPAESTAFGIPAKLKGRVDK